MTTAVQQLDALLERHRDGGRIEYSDLIALRAALYVPAPVQEPIKPPGMAVQALAGEIIEALLADEKDGGYDLTAGLFGAAFSKLVRRWAVAEWNAPQAQQPAQQEPVTEIISVDEYGPLLRWNTHWTKFPTGTKLFTAPQAQQPAPEHAAELEPTQRAQAAAVRTLEYLGYTYHDSLLWKPPLGKPQPAPMQGPPDITHPAINDMCWKVIETLPDGMSAAYFNYLKPAIYDGLKVYHAELVKCQKAGLK